jgi:SAM-dependent methyltransferase
MTENRLYSDLSGYYDLLCSEIDYVEQSAAALRIHQAFGAGGLEYLDLACGTGPHIEQFIRYGYRSTGLDLNAAMLTLAARRCTQAEFSLQNMSDFSFAKKFDLVTCFLYSIHYCYPSSRLLSAFERTFSALNSGGVFCFDAVNKNKIANDAGIKHRLNKDGVEFAFQSRWQYPVAGDAMKLVLNIERGIGAEQQFWQDEHTMCAVDVQFLTYELTRLGFEVTMLERDFTRLIPWDGISGNVLVVCVKL